MKFIILIESKLKVFSKNQLSRFFDSKKITKQVPIVVINYLRINNLNIVHIKRWITSALHLRRNAKHD